MAGGESLQKLDATGKPLLENLSKYMKLNRKENLLRVQKAQRMRRNNLITAGVLGVGVIGMFSYSILAVLTKTNI